MSHWLFKDLPSEKMDVVKESALVGAAAVAGYAIGGGPLGVFCAAVSSHWILKELHRKETKG